MSGLHRATIAVAPVGAVDPEAVAMLVPAIRDAFRAEVVVAPPVPLPPRAWNARRRQHLATVLLDELASAWSPTWDRLLGACDVDLYVPELNFVFGLADQLRKVAVYSLARRREPGAGAESHVVFERRAVTEAVHELGHTYGLGHCDDPRCVMWFSNTLAESDRKGASFCDVHARALVEDRR